VTAAPGRRVLRVGIVGAGGIGRIHAEHLRSLEGVRVTAVLDADEVRADHLADACGGTSVSDLEALFGETDAIYVCSPPTFHRDHVVAAASAGKHVFCEKPLATTLEDGRAIVEAMAAAPGHAMVGFNNRFRPAFRRWRELIRDELGVPRSGWIARLAPSTPERDTNWRTTAGLLCGITVESAAHDVDTIRWALGEVGSVSATTSSSMPDLEGYDDALHAVLRLDVGVPVSLLIDWSSTISMSSRGVVGSGGTVHLAGPDMWTISELRWAPTNGPELVELIDGTQGADLGYRAETEHFIRCLVEDRPPAVTIDDGFAALEVSLAMRTAAAEGNTVRIRAA
jgi:myo-inositol 2-dehydrogenase / D-chiro-inositol 1-dehydrogenase